MNSSSRISRRPSPASPSWRYISRDRLQADSQRDQEDRLDGEQPEAVVEKQVGAEAGEDQVEHDEVGDGAAAQAHTVISYFSKRR